MLSWKKNSAKIKRLRKRKRMFEDNIISIKQKIYKIDKKLFDLIVPKK